MIREKNWKESKKFAAFILANLLWSFLMGLSMWRLDNVSLVTVLIGMSLVLGFVQVGYILGQSSLDLFTRLAGIIKNQAPELEDEEK